MKFCFADLDKEDIPTKFDSISDSDIIKRQISLTQSADGPASAVQFDPFTTVYADSNNPDGEFVVAETADYVSHVTLSLSGHL